jgi:hypothetical protein
MRTTVDTLVVKVPEAKSGLREDYDITILLSFYIFRLLLQKLLT